jgi:hypothetical protein
MRFPPERQDCLPTIAFSGSSGILFAIRGTPSTRFSSSTESERIQAVSALPKTPPS